MRRFSGGVDGEVDGAAIRLWDSGRQILHYGLAVKFSHPGACHAGNSWLQSWEEPSPPPPSSSSFPLRGLRRCEGAAIAGLPGGEEESRGISSGISS